MRFQLISDVHGRFDMVQKDPHADIIISPGDISENLTKGISFLQGLEKLVLITPGNHEFYKFDMTERIEEIKYLCSRTENVIFLDNDTLELEQNGENIRIIGTTLWSDFGNLDPLLVDSSDAFMNDYMYIGAKQLLSDPEFAKKVEGYNQRIQNEVGHKINLKTPEGEIFKNNYYQKLRTIESKLGKNVGFDRNKITSEDYPMACKFKHERYNPIIAYMLHLENRRWLEEQLSQPYNGRTLVLTHHAPSRSALSMSRFTTAIPTMDFSSILKRNTSGYKIGAYCSSFENSPNLDNIDGWVHGHFHERMLYRLGGAAVHCNPTGNASNQPDRTGLPQYSFNLTEEEKTQALKQHLKHTLFIADKLNELYKVALSDNYYFERLRYEQVYYNIYDELQTLLNSLRTTPEFKENWGNNIDLFLPIQKIFGHYLTVKDGYIHPKDMYQLVNETRNRVSEIGLFLSNWQIEVNSKIKEKFIFKDFTSENIEITTENKDDKLEGEIHVE